MTVFDLLKNQLLPPRMLATGLLVANASTADRNL